MEIREVAPGSADWSALEPGGATGWKSSDPVPADARCWVALAQGAPAARVSAMLRPGLQGVEDPPWGVVGHYEAATEAAGVALLRHAAASLRERGATRVIGPMNGGTSYGYRLALPPEPGDPVFTPPAFLGEPAHPAAYPGHFAAAGFRATDRYESRIYEDLSLRNPRAAETAVAVEALGIAIRPVDLARWDDELGRFHAMCSAAFARNRYFEPLTLEAFRRLHRGAEAIVDPGLFLVAEARDGRTVGVAFGYPDLACGPRPDRFVLKTLACAPDTRGLGLAVHLTERLHLAGHERGMRSAIHALMNVDNRSAALSQRNASRIFKRYALFEWRPA